MKKFVSFIKSKSFRSFSFSVAGMFLLLMFQNCGQEFDDTGTTIDSTEAEYAQSLPFAFDFDIDQIGYMSCNGEALDADSRFFSFKAGAYGDGSGISLKSEFRALAEAGRLYDDKMADALFTSDRNTGAGLVLALRTASNLQSTVGSTSETIGGVFFDRDVNLTLSQSDVADQLVDAVQDQRINTFNLSGLGDNRSVDGEITFPISESAVNTIRNRIASNEYLLSLTFATATGENDNFPGQRARSQHDTNGVSTDAGRYVFGKAYNMQFYQYDVNITGSQSRSVSRISRATNLEDGSSLNENWECPDDEKYIIVRPSDALRSYSNGVTFIRRNTGSEILLGTNGNINVAYEPWDYEVGNPEGYSFDSGEDGLRPGTNVVGNSATGNCIELDGNNEEIPNETDEDCIIRNNEMYISDVVCPLYPDDVPTTENQRIKWKRVRNMLPHRDWHVFRGTDNGYTYNCVVPKGGGEACYGEANENTNPSFVVQYQSDEDYSGFSEDVRPRIESNCGSGTQKFCPHILSICYKR